MRQYFRKYLFAVAMLSFFLSFAQEESITGRVYDTDGEATPFANVLMLRPGDSVLVKGATTDGEGRFSLKVLRKAITF